MDNQDREKKLRELVLYLYMVYATGFIMCFASFAMASLGTIMGLIAIIVTYAKRNSAKGTIYESHFTWLVRTFWIGGAVFLPIATIIFTILFITMTDFMEFMQNSVTNLGSGTQQLSIEFVTRNLEKLNNIKLITMIPVLLWWLIRCYRGAKLAFKNKKINRDNSWL